MRFDSKISALEEREDLATLTMDELHGTLTTYYMRTENHNIVMEEVTFKSSKKTKKKSNQKEKSDSSNNNILEDDEEVANFVKRLKRGTEKYRGKIQLICFNYDSIGHFYNKCPHKKKKRNEEYDSKRKNIYKGKITKNNFFKKSLCTKEDSSSSDEDEVNDTDIVTYPTSHRTGNATMNLLCYQL
jgi:hypothetical protein